MSDDPAKWTPAAGAAHLRETFDRNCRQFPDIMDGYLVPLAEARDEQERVDIMRAALRGTFRQRFPGRYDDPQPAAPRPEA